MISSALPVAGFVGIAFRQLSRFDLSLGPKKPLGSQSGLLVRQWRWRRRKSRGDTHAAERSVGGGFRVRGTPLSKAKGYHKTTQHRKNNKKHGNPTRVFVQPATIRSAHGPACSARFDQDFSCCKASVGWEHLFRAWNSEMLFRPCSRWQRLLGDQVEWQPFANTPRDLISRASQRPK